MSPLWRHFRGTDAGRLENARLLFRVLHLTMPLFPVLHILARWNSAECEAYQVVTLLCGTLSTAVAIHSLVTAAPALQELHAYFKMSLVCWVLFPAFVFGSSSATKDHVLAVTTMGPNVIFATIAMRAFLEREDAPLLVPVSFQLGILPYLDSLALYRSWSDASMHWLTPCIVESMCAHIIIAVCLQYNSTTLISERRCLKEAQDSLKNLLAAQMSLWRSIFDASCMCDADGFVIHATSQMHNLLFGASSQEASQQRLVGRALYSFAASSVEKKQLIEFVQNAGASTQQAAMVQTTLAAPDASTDCHVEVKLFGIRVACQLPANSDAGERLPWEQNGIFLGMQLMEAKASEVPRLRGDSRQAWAQEQELSIRFDAGSDDFDIRLLDPALRTGQLRREGLLDWLPRRHASQFERWVVQEVQRAPNDRVGVSVSAIEHLELEVPVFRTRRLSAERAWLEMEPMVDTVDGPSLPVTLKLAGVTSTGFLAGATGEATESNQDDLEAKPDNTNDLASVDESTDLSMCDSCEDLVLRRR